MTIKREDISSIDLRNVLTGQPLAHVTPGDVLRTKFLELLGLSARALARNMAVPVTRITEILHGERVITAEAALLGRAFETSPKFWLGLQNAHDLEVARKNLGWTA